MSWIHDPWLGFDTETTGVDVHQDRLVTAAVILRTGGVNPNGDDLTRTWLADPGVPIPPAASAVHGISTEYAREHGRNIVEVLDEVAHTLVEHWAKGYPVVVFNAPFDITLLNHELRRHGLGSLEERLDGTPMTIIDPLLLDRAVDRFRKGKRTLTTMAPIYGVASSPDAHIAQVDVQMTLDVLAGMAKVHRNLTEFSSRELHDYQIAKYREWAESFTDFLRRSNKHAYVDPSWPQASQ